MLTPTVCEFLVQQPPARIQIQGQWVAVHTRGRPTPETVERLVTTATSMVAVVCAAW